MTARWRWRLVRRMRFRRAQAAMCDGRPGDALRMLAHAGAVGDTRAERLSAIATVLAVPELPHAARCVDALHLALNRPGHEAAPEELSMATAALELALRLGPGDGLERVTNVAQLTGRLMAITGSLPWGRYNLAVHALSAGEFDAAAGHLAAGATAPAAGWPPPLLGAACAALLGKPAELSRWLTGPAVYPGFAHDHQFLTGVDEVFGSLHHDRPIDEARLIKSFGDPPGPLTQTIPQLAALKNLLTDTIFCVPSRTKPADLSGCVWGQWLCDRLRYAGGEAVEVVRPFLYTGGDESALSWQRLGSQQDLLALLPADAAQSLRQHLVDFKRDRASGVAWAGLVELRVRLAGESTVADDPTSNSASNLASSQGAGPGPEPCPWWPADGVLQASARRDGEVEHCYLEGRHSLRRGLPADARRWFATARARLTGQGIAARLVGLRFGPLLEYWEGVTLAHLGLAHEAASALRTCANGIKAREARAQLGLLAVATGDHAAGTEQLATIPEPRPAAAGYLAAVLAARHGDATATERLLEHYEERRSIAGVYLAAGHRLRGRMHETKGEIAEATDRYRHALTHRQEDTVAAARLARVWLHQRYEADIPPEPLLDRQWLALTKVAWAAALPLLRDCLDPTAGTAERLLDRVPADPGLRLLAFRTAIAAGVDRPATEAITTWADADDPDPRLVCAADAARSARLIRDFCFAGGTEPLRLELAELERRLRPSTADPARAFWAGAARLMLNPESTATAPPLAAMEDESRSTPVRLFAGLMSVFAEDPEQRLAGALCCQAVLDAEPVAGMSTQAAVRCLVTHAVGDDREFLTAYDEIETRARPLPCDLAATYLTATEARLRIGDLDAVIDGFIPEPLADLADPGVRHAMVIAYARRAAHVADQNPRAALQDLDQARELLREAS